MKKTINVNIGSVGFIMDEDAYFALSSYFDDIRSRLYEPERDEIMDDIESRTADLFNENISFSSQVVTIDHVRRAIAVIGSAQTFGEKKYDRDYQGTPRDNGYSPSRKFYRSRTDSILAGVCGGIAEYFGADSSIIRVIMLLLMIFGGLSIWIYIIVWIIVPLRPWGEEAQTGWKSHKERRGRR